MWVIIKRLTGTFYQHKYYIDATVHATDASTFYMLESSGVTQLDSTDLYSALDEAQALLVDSRTART
jgi:hypothetical protein